MAAQGSSAWGDADGDVNCHADTHSHSNLDTMANPDTARVLSAAHAGSVVPGADPACTATAVSHGCTLADIPAGAATRYSDAGAGDVHTVSHPNHCYACASVGSVPNTVASCTGIHTGPSLRPDTRYCARTAATGTACLSPGTARRADGTAAATATRLSPGTARRAGGTAAAWLRARPSLPMTAPGEKVFRPRCEPAWES
jgi:hypothetical protein